MNYLLDANVVAYFIGAGQAEALSAASKMVSMTIVAEVRDELLRDKVRGGRWFEAWLAGSKINTRSILTGSAAATTLGALMPAEGVKDVGERASIALAVHDPTLCFVTHDKNGLWIAVRETWSPGERLLGLAPFLRRLYEAKALVTPEVLDQVVAMIPQQRPTWWSSWRGSIE